MGDVGGGFGDVGFEDGIEVGVGFGGRWGRG